MDNSLINKCRICLKFSSDTQMDSFFTMYFEDLSLANIFMNITSYEVKEDDNLPKRICISCKNCVINFNNMLSVFHDTEIFFQKLIDTDNIKNEDIDIIDDNNVDNDDYIDEKKVVNNTIDETGEYKYLDSFKYTCECGDCFLYKAAIRQHIHVKHNKLLEDEDLDKYAEKIQLKLPTEFPNNIEYVYSKFSNKKNKLQCRICNELFQNEEQVKNHQEIHKNFICDHCGAAFIKKHYLADHIRIHSEIRPYSCKLCQKSFKHRYTYTAHKKSHDLSRNFVCECCGADFKTKGTLHTHIKIKHTNIRNFSCPNCNLKFNLKSTLTKHIQRKHTLNRRKSFVCSKCGVAYSNKTTLTSHFSEKHLGQVKNFPCNICENKMYVMKKGLMTHMLKKHGIVYQ